MGMNARPDPGTVIAVAPRPPNDQRSVKVRLSAASGAYARVELGKLIIEFGLPEIARLQRVSARTIHDVLLWSVFAWQHAFAPEAEREEYLRAIARQLGDDRARMLERQMARRREMFAHNKVGLGPLRVEARGGYRYDVFAEPPIEPGDS
jgi:hypothetical protein